MVPEDRKEQGLILQMSVRDNVTLPLLQELYHWGRIDRHRQNAVTQYQVDQLKIQTPSIFQLAQNLSGGNQQKVVLAKWLAKQCRLLILDEPTRGIDVGAKYEMYKIMNSLVRDGKGILLVSSDLPEVIAMSDRIYVMRDGELIAELPGQVTAQETIIEHITRGEGRAIA
jgi:ABC-type sugar transport system ATPase subunit